MPVRQTGGQREISTETKILLARAAMGPWKPSQKEWEEYEEQDPARRRRGGGKKRRR